MRICQACGAENADDADFCSCGEYLRWEPTSHMAAITDADIAAAKAAAAAPAEPTPAAESPSPAERAAPPEPEPEPEAPAYETAQLSVPKSAAPPAPAAPQPASVPEPAAAPEPVAAPAPPAAAPVPAPEPVAAAPAAPAAAPAPPAPPAPEGASIQLRLPDDEGRAQSPLAVGVEPGQRVRVLALVRNESKIVDNYDLELRGIPREWWTVAPATLYLVPFGAAGLYEQEVEIHLHPPRTPDAQARIWRVELVAHSRAQGAPAAIAPLALGVQPYQQLEQKVTPDRRSGRRRVRYEVSIRNVANAPASVALGARDADGECRTAFAERTLEVEPGASARTQLTVRPPRQRWIGRPIEWRLEVSHATGEDGERLLVRDDDLRAQQKKGVRKLPGLRGGGVTMPSARFGPQGFDVTAPRLREPSLPQVDVGRELQGLDLKSLKPGGGGGPAAPAAPLLPGQIVFRQRAWLPWWLAVVLPILLALLLFLFLFLPRNVEVPKVEGEPSVFAAQQKLEDVGLKLDPSVQKVSKPGAKPGSVIGQAPKPGKKVRKGGTVALQVAVGSGSVAVPDIVGKTLPDAEQALRGKGLVIGRTSVTPPDLKAKISSQIPAAGESVKEGSPIDLYYAKPKGKDGGADGAGGGGGGDGKAVKVPDVDPKDLQGYSAKVSDAGLVPQAVRQFSDAPKGEVFGTEPAAGQEVKAGAPVRVLVSAGFPQLVFDDDKDVLRIDGATGKKLAPIAKTDALEKDPVWTPDGKQVAYTRDGRIMLVDATKEGAEPVALTPEGERYADLAFAPTPERLVLTAGRIGATGDRDLCFGLVTGGAVNLQCKADDDFSVADADWAPNGRRILAPAVRKNGAFGIVSYTTDQAFSPRASDWSGGKFVTPLDADGGTGVIDAAISPDGKQVAVAANVDTPQFRLLLTTIDDLRLEQAKPLPVQACKVAWRPDGRELVVVQLGEDCGQDTGQLFRIAVGKTDTAVPLSASGDNVAFQPLSGG